MGPGDKTEINGYPIRGGELLDADGRPLRTSGFAPVPARPATGIPRPVITIALISICSFIFVAMTVSGASITAPSNSYLVGWGANFGVYTLRGQWWRLLTSAFVHIGLLHLLFNMWCLRQLGQLAEVIYGRWKFLAIYLICAVFSGVASIAWQPRSISAGASGAIFGVAGALLATFYLRKLPLPPQAIKPVLRSLVTFALINLAFGAMVPGIDNAAHVGGLGCGLVIGAILPKRKPQPAAAVSPAE